MIVGVKTGGELWAVIVSDDIDFIENSVVECIVTAKKIYTGERISIDGIKEERVEKLKNIAEKKLNNKKLN